ncbi:hypothetical protein D3C86_1516400 [compost metagenome]
MPKIEARRRLGIRCTVNDVHARQGAQQGIGFALIRAIVQAVMHQIVFHERLQGTIQDLAICSVVGLILLHQHGQQRAIGQRGRPRVSEHIRQRHNIGVMRDQGPAQLIYIRGALFLPIGGQAYQA